MARSKQAEQGTAEKGAAPDEKTVADGDPFADVEDLSPGLKYILEQWHLDDAPENATLVIEGHVTEMSTSWTVKGHDWLTAKMTYEPVDLKCDLLIHKPRAAIIAAQGDLGIVAEVFRQFANMTSRESRKVMVAHQGKVYPEPPEEPRVSSGERKVPTEESVDYG